MINPVRIGRPLRRITGWSGKRSRPHRADLTRSVPSHDAAIEVQDLGFQCQQLSAESRHAGSCYPLGVECTGIGYDFGQLLDPTALDRCDDPVLGQVRANGIDDGRLLANEQMPCAVEFQTALVLGRVGRHSRQPHRSYVV